MIINEEKDWLDSFSKAGKSATKIHIICTKVLLNKQPRKKKKSNHSAISAFDFENRIKLS
jgi:hypothetical protein